MGTITRGYRIRAYPNGAQRRLLDRWFGATGWRGWAARALGTKIVAETEQERVQAYSWRGTLYAADWFPPDANFYHD